MAQRRKPVTLARVDGGESSALLKASPHPTEALGATEATLDRLLARWFHRYGGENYPRVLPRLPHHHDPVTTIGSCPFTPDADTDDTPATDQPDTDPSSWAGRHPDRAKRSPAKNLNGPGHGEAEGSANCDAVEADQARNRRR